MFVADHAPQSDGGALHLLHRGCSQSFRNLLVPWTWFLIAVLSPGIPLQAESQDWPQWRGPLRNGTLPPESPLPANLPENLTPVWKVPVGPGFSSPVLQQNTLLYTDLQNDLETAHLLDLRTGRELWKTAYAEGFGDEWGKGPRSTPLLDGDLAYVQSCKGEFRCLLARDGSTVWRTHFETNFGVQFVGTKVLEGAAARRGHNSSALIHQDQIIVPVGSTNGATLVSFHKRTGAILWKTLHDESAYSSPILATLAGQLQIVTLTADALTGVDPQNGQLLWRIPIITNAKRHAVAPVLIDDHHLFIASHSLGGQAIEIQRDSSHWTARVAWSNPTLKINLSTPVLHEKNLYGLGAGPDYLCIDAATGRIRWAQPGFGRGVKTDYASSILGGSRILIMDESGQLVLIEAQPEKYTELGRVQVSGKTWSHPAYAHGQLVVRDQRELKCFRLMP